VTTRYLAEYVPSGASVTIGQATETDTAQAFGRAKTAALGQALETDTAQAIASVKHGFFLVGQALETDTAQTQSPRRSELLGQATEADTAQAISRSKSRAIGEASETDTAQGISAHLLHLVAFAQVGERDYAQPVEPALASGGSAGGEGGPGEPGGSLVFLRRPGGIGRVFHEVVSRSGEVYHPTLEGWEAEEEAPGGSGSASGRISESTYLRHRDVFRAGSKLRTFLDADGTCIHASRLREPAVSGMVTLSGRGVADRAEKEFDRIFYAAVGTTGWTSLESDVTVDRQPGNEGLGDNRTTLEIGRNLRWHFQADGQAGQGLGQPVSFVAFDQDLQRLTGTIRRDGDVQVLIQALSTDQLGNLGIPLGDGTVYDETDTPGVVEFDVDLTATPPDAQHDPVDWVVVIPIFPTDGPTGDGDATQTGLEISDLKLFGNGASEGMQAGDLIVDIAGRLGIRWTDIAGGGAKVMPKDFASETYADVLDYAVLLSGWTWGLRDTGAHTILEAGPYGPTWRLSSPHARFEPVEAERFDRVRVPFLYSDGVTVGSVLVRAERNPEEIRNTYGRLSLTEPVADEERAQALGKTVVEQLILPRWGGSGSAAELIDENGVRVSARRARAGSILSGEAVGGPAALRIARITHREEAPPEFDFDGGLRALDRMLGRRDRRLSLRSASA